jgi:hypothetical protein
MVATNLVTLRWLSLTASLAASLNRIFSTWVNKEMTEVDSQNQTELKATAARRRVCCRLQKRATLLAAKLDERVRHECRQVGRRCVETRSVDRRKRGRRARVHKRAWAFAFDNIFSTTHQTNALHLSQLVPWLKNLTRPLLVRNKRRADQNNRRFAEMESISFPKSVAAFLVKFSHLLVMMPASGSP